MDRYLDWAEQEYRQAIDIRDSLTADLVSLEEQVQMHKTSYESNMGKAQLADTKGDNSARQIFGGNAQDDLDVLKDLEPLRADAEERVTQITDLTEVFKIKFEQLQYKLQAQRTKFETLRKTAKGFAKFNNFVSGNSQAAKIYAESERQLRERMAQFAANINAIQTDLKPVLQSAQFDKELRKQNVDKLLAEFNKTNF